ncbi:MAG: hypothetical protein J6X85_06515 [Ruminococcus sp.]|nr:hypothetical protein [Ruminococcus sp.]MBP5581423.1 hypothetical protein [Ruminococcus sp.]
MKKNIFGLTASAIILAAVLAGCGADKEKASEKVSSSSVADTTTAADTTAEKNKDTKENKESSENSETSTGEALSLKDIAGPYHKNGHAYMGNYPDELDPDHIEELMKDDPMTISEDGTLHFCGKDYKLTAEGKSGEDDVFSIEGSGAEYSNNSCKADKDYEGVCAFVHATQHMTVNGEDYPYDTYMLYLKQKGDKKCFGYISVDQGEADESDNWNWDWDDDDDTE